MVFPPSHPLTFGVEIECIARVPSDLMDSLIERYAHRGPRTNRQVLTYYLSEQLNKAGIPCHRYDVSRSLRSEKKTYSQWTFDDDLTIRPCEPPSFGGGNSDGCLYYGLELISRRMLLDNLEDVRVAEWWTAPKAGGGIAEIGRVLKVLDDIDVHFFTNASCGLHVPIALAPPDPQSRSPPFPFPTLRAFSMLATTFEPCINTILAPRRLESIYCIPPSRAFSIQLSLSQRLAIIQIQATVRGVIEVMNPSMGRSYAYNFQNMLEKPKASGPSNTIEFRQHQGTLSFGEIEVWVQVVAGMVRRGLDAGTEERCMMLAKRAEEGQLTLADFLGEIGKEGLVGYYEQQRVAGHTSAP